jgi:hypothetical protein
VARADDDPVAQKADAIRQERSLGWIVGGVGLATLGAGGLFLASTGSNDVASARDFDRGCGVAAIGIGAVVSGVGAWLALTADQRVKLVPAQEAHGWGLRVVTTW